MSIHEGCFLALMLFPVSLLIALEVPLEFHGGGFMGKYMNSDTIRYNLDASFEIYCTTLRHRNISTYVFYRDDLDMAEQTGGVSIDPRYAHYYIAFGLDYFFSNYVITGYFVHDCIHDIDYDVEGTPVFNRFRLKLAPHDYHYSSRLKTAKRFLWSVDIGYYPHWDYAGWDINSGADYRYDVALNFMFNVVSSDDFGIDLKPRFLFTKGDTTVYHQHRIGLLGYYKKSARRIGLSLDYNLYNNDPLKSPNKLWLFSVYLEF
jgi:hypothetical protein